MLMTKIETEEFGFVDSFGVIYPSNTNNESEVVNQARILGLAPVVRVRTEYVVADTVGEWQVLD